MGHGAGVGMDGWDDRIRTHSPSHDKVNGEGINDIIIQSLKSGSFEGLTIASLEECESQHLIEYLNRSKQTLPYSGLFHNFFSNKS